MSASKKSKERASPMQGAIGGGGSESGGEDGRAEEAQLERQEEVLRLMRDTRADILKRAARLQGLVGTARRPLGAQV